MPDPYAARKVWSALRRQPASAYLFPRFDEMRKVIQQNERVREKLSSDELFTSFYAAVKDRSISSIPVARTLLVSLLHRYEQLRYGKAITPVPFVRNPGNYNNESETNRLKKLSPAQLLSERKHIALRLREVRKRGKS